MPKRYGQRCPVAKSLELVGDRWTLLVVRDLLSGPRRFQDLQKSLKGIAPAVLSDRLKLMEDGALVERRLYCEHPPRAEYALTERGRGLGLVVSALAAWGTRHVFPDAALVHADCGHEVVMRYYCPRCGDRVRGSTVSVARRAAASTRGKVSRASPGVSRASPRVSPASPDRRRSRGGPAP